MIITSLIRRLRVKTLVARWLFLLPVFCVFTARAQDTDTMTIDVARVRFWDFIYKQCWFASAPTGQVTEQNIPRLNYKANEVINFHPGVPNYLMENDIFLRMELYNSTDSVKTVSLLPALYCREITVYKQEKSTAGSPQLAALSSSETRNKTYPGVRNITLQPHEQSTYYCKFRFVRTNVNVFLPRLIEQDYVGQWITDMTYRDEALDIFTYVVAGILLLMIFYSLAVFLQNRSKEFIYYAIYTFCTASLLFLKSYLNASSSSFNFFYEEYLDFMILSCSVLSYLIFVRQFINTAQNHPFLDKFLVVTKWVLLALCFVFTAIYFLNPKYVWLFVIENLVIKSFFFLTGVIFIIYGIRKKDALLNYLVAGNFALIVFSVISQIIILFGWQLVPGDTTSIFNRAMFYYEIGLVLELGFFLSGLAYKNRRDIISRVKEREKLKLDNERKEFEKQMAVMAAKQEERDRISADMHDELGSGLTAIRLMSEIVKSRMQNSPVPEMEKISTSANDILSKMNTIIWTMKSSNDTLESLVAYIRAHAIEYFDNTPIDCSVKVPAVIPQVDVTGEKRRNIFLSVKEALNNAMKHSQATRLQINISAIDHKLVIEVTDNGVGIDQEKLRRFGNGLSNMRRRMESIDGLFRIENNGQCTLHFEAPI